MDPKCARFPGGNANLTNGTHFTHIQGGGGVSEDEAEGGKSTGEMSGLSEVGGGWAIFLILGGRNSVK